VSEYQYYDFKEAGAERKLAARATTLAPVRPMTSFALVPSARAELWERLRPANDLTEGRRPEQVIAYLVPTEEPRSRCEITAVVQQIDETRLRRIGNVERPAGEEFIEETKHAGWVRRSEPFQDEQVEVFMTQRESQLAAEGLAGPVPLVEDVPAHLLPTARLDVLFGYGARAADRGLNAEWSKAPLFGRKQPVLPPIGRKPIYT
jgi:hypothetical protein